MSGQWFHFPFLPSVAARVDVAGWVHFSRPLDHAEHLLVQAACQAATSPDRPFTLAPGSCRDCA
jgi:hypothetical protein